MVTSVLMFDARYPPPVVGGKEKQAHLLSKALLKAGVDVSVVTFRHAGNCSGFFEGVEVVRYRQNIHGHLALMLSIARRRRRYQVLHVHTPSRIGLLVALCGGMAGYRVFFKLPNVGLLSSKGGIEGALRRYLARRIAVTVALEEESAQILRTNGVDVTRIMLADNGVEVTGDMIARRSCPNDHEFLFVSRLVPHKRCDDLLRAFIYAGLSDSNAIVRVLGDGPMRRDLENLAAELAISDKVIFEGNVEDVPRFMARAGCLVVCSEKEGMSNVVLEAMSIGLPVISTKVGGVTRALGEFGSRFTYSPGDVRYLAYLMSQFVKNPSFSNGYGQYLFERCTKRFEISRVAETYIQKYSESGCTGI